MKTLKVMTIVGICFFSLLFISAATEGTAKAKADELEGLLGFGAVYGLALSIVGLIQANKTLAAGRGATGGHEPPPQRPAGTGNKPPLSSLSPTGSKIAAVQPFEEELRKLADLKRDGIVSEEEFNQKKKTLLGL